jgi:hypothetical protein
MLSAHSCINLSEERVDFVFQKNVAREHPAHRGAVKSIRVNAEIRE